MLRRRAAETKAISKTELQRFCDFINSVIGRRGKAWTNGRHIAVTCTLTDKERQAIMDFKYTGRA